MSRPVCPQCRTYINPFVHFVDQRRWRCNVCYRVNELPEEFLYDPVSKSFGDPSRRPECKVSPFHAVYVVPVGEPDTVLNLTLFGFISFSSSRLRLSSLRHLSTFFGRLNPQSTFSSSTSRVRRWRPVTSKPSVIHS